MLVYIITRTHQTTAVTSRWRRRRVASHRLVLVHAAIQVADLSNQHRYGRHTGSSSTTTTMLQCSVAVFLAIDHRFTIAY